MRQSIRTDAPRSGTGLPAELHCNAWTGTDTPVVAVANTHLDWQPSAALRVAPPLPSMDRAAGKFDPTQWRSPDIGWGLVLPDHVGWTAERLASAEDAEPPIQRLVAARGRAPVIRWRPDGSDVGCLVRYVPRSGTEYPVSMSSAYGVDDGQLPLYLLICAPPESIPWAFQYMANTGRYVGRLWLEGQALDNYVSALIDDWSDADCDVHAPLVWSVDHGSSDITRLMDGAISRKLVAAWQGDADGDLSRLSYLRGEQATHAALIDTLASTRPGLVVTTSHGMTGPLHDPERLRAQLGLPVDMTHRALELDALADAWQPGGAIWYSHACCAAGSDVTSAYEGLFDRSSSLMRVLAGVAAGCKARIAPLPQRLLGAKQPLRAFIGHVEPTFDWTMRDPSSGEPLTHNLVEAFYKTMFESATARQPIGHVQSVLYRAAASLMMEWRSAEKSEQQGVSCAVKRALHRQIQALDLQHTVLLGDPTVALPSLRDPRQLAGTESRGASQGVGEQATPRRR